MSQVRVFQSSLSDIQAMLMYLVQVRARVLKSKIVFVCALFLWAFKYPEHISQNL